MVGIRQLLRLFLYNQQGNRRQEGGPEALSLKTHLPSATSWTLHSHSTSSWGTNCSDTSWWEHFTFTPQHILCSSQLTERRQVSKEVQRLLWKIPVSLLCCVVSPGHFPFSCALLKRHHQRKQTVPAAFLSRDRGCKLEVSSVSVWCRSWHFNAGCSCLGKIEELSA